MAFLKSIHRSAAPDEVARAAGLLAISDHLRLPSAALAQAEEDRPVPGRAGDESHAWLGRVRWLLGYPDKAVQVSLDGAPPTPAGH